MKYTQRLMIPHFAELVDSPHVLDLNDGFSRILMPHQEIRNALSDQGTPNNLSNLFGDFTWRHVNFFTFLQLFECIDRYIEVPTILETGSSAHGTNSSMLFAGLAAESGGTFDTVDINTETYQRVSKSILGKFGVRKNLRCHCGDSIEFIRNYFGASINVAYLDSYDLEVDSFEQSAWHGYQEFCALVPKLCKKLAFILVDDTPRTIDIFEKMFSGPDFAGVQAYLHSTGSLPGKGRLIVEKIKNDGRFKIIAWEYQILILYSDSPNFNGCCASAAPL